jgi:hypothetical protein
MKKKWLVVMLVSFLSVFVLFGCLPTQSEEEPEESPEEQPVEPVEPVMLKAYLPESTPATATIYLMGSYNVDSNNNWIFTDAATSEVKTEGEQMYAEFDISNLFDYADYPVFYKYTYDATWTCVETDASGGDILNRRLDVAPESDVVEVVLNWKGMDPIDYTDLQQEVTVNFVVHVPEGTESDVIYMKGLNGDWDNSLILNKDADTGYYTTEATTTSYTIQEYKFTLSEDWTIPEGDANGGPLYDNRIIILTDDATIENVIESWEN